MGLVMDLQADLMDWLETRVVAPLVPVSEAPEPARHLNPVFDVENERFVLLTQSMAAVPLFALGRKGADLSNAADRITRTVDMVFQGF